MPDRSEYTPQPSRRLAAGAVLLSLIAAGPLAIASAAAAAQARLPVAQGPADPSLPPRLRDAVAILGDSSASEHARLEAARALVLAPTDSARATIIGLLASPEDDPAPALLLRALTESFNPALRSALLAGIQPASGWPEGRRASAIRALALDQSRDTISGLIDRLAPAEAPAVRSAATSALIRITGRDDDEARRRGAQDAWRSWFHDRALLPENLWLADLAAGCSARADRLADGRRDVEAQYRAAMEQLYSASDAVQRHAMLLAMLREPLPAIRQLGLDLVERALDGSQRIAPDVAGRIIELLTDTTPDIRGRAALLIDRLRPEGASAAVAEALLREKDPEVAGRLLLALRNWPTPVTRDVTLRWLAFDDPAVRRRAARATLAAVEAGVIARPEDHRAIVAALRKPPPATLSREGMQLLAQLGDAGDREFLGSLLTDPDASTRRLAALALADHPDYRPRLIEAAAEDPQLLPVVVSAIAAGSAAPTIADFDALAAIIPPDAPREDHLAAIASALSLTDLLELALRDIRARTEAEAAGAAADAAGADPPDGTRPDRNGPPAAGPLAEPGGAGGSGGSGGSGIEAAQPLVLGALPSPVFTERILASAVDRARAINGARPDEAPTLARALLLLAELRLSLDRPDTALAAIEAIHPAWNPDLRPEIAHTRTVALLLLGRLDDPRLAGSPDAWLDALDRCIQRQFPHTHDLQRATLSLAETFTDRQRERYEQIAAAIPPQPPASPPDDSGDPATTPDDGG